jgi:hypothetical protein
MVMGTTGESLILLCPHVLLLENREDISTAASPAEF